MTEADSAADRLDRPRPSIATVLLEWGRIGCIGFGGPPTHIRLLRELCVDRKRWMGADEFEDAIAACNLLPGPSSTQLSVYCAWRVRGHLGAVVGGLAFIVPGLIVILALAAVFLGSPPRWVLAAGAGAGAAVAGVAVHAAAGLLPDSWQRANKAGRARKVRWAAYVIAGIIATATIGTGVVLVLIACGAVELTVRVPRDNRPTMILPLPMLASGATTVGVLSSVAWVAFKVGRCPTAAAS